MTPIIVIQEAGLDGFWIHRVLQIEGIESHVVDPASIATSRRRRRAKTDKIDGEALVRTLLAYKRGEPRVCAMVKAPTPEEEGRPNKLSFWCLVAKNFVVKVKLIVALREILSCFWCLATKKVCRGRSLTSPLILFGFSHFGLSKGENCFASCVDGK